MHQFIRITFTGYANRDEMHHVNEQLNVWLLTVRMDTFVYTYIRQVQ